MDLAEYLDSLVNQAERDTFLQQLLHLGFRYPFSELEYVRPSRHARGYIRKKPSSYVNPSPAQLEARISFGKTAYDLYGMKGTVSTPDDRQIPKISKLIGNRVHGLQFKDPAPKQVIRLRKALKGIEKKIIFLPSMYIKI